MTRAFENLAASQSSVLVTGSRETQRFPRPESVSPTFFATPGIVPALDRNFLAVDDRPGIQPAVTVIVVIWRRFFNTDRDILNGNITPLALTFAAHAAPAAPEESDSNISGQAL